MNSPTVTFCWLNMRLKRVRAPTLAADEARDEPYFNGTTPLSPLVFVGAPVFVLQVIQGKPQYSVLICRVISTLSSVPENYLVIRSSFITAGCQRSGHCSNMASFSSHQSNSRLCSARDFSKSPVFPVLGLSSIGLGHWYVWSESIPWPSEQELDDKTRPGLRWALREV